MIGSLKTDSRVLLVVRVVREAREGGMVSEMVYVVTMSPKVGMPSPSDVMLGTTSSSFSSCVSLEEVGARVERIGRWMVAAAVRRGECTACKIINSNHHYEANKQVTSSEKMLHS